MSTVSEDGSPPSSRIDNARKALDALTREERENVVGKSYYPKNFIQPTQRTNNIIIIIVVIGFLIALAVSFIGLIWVYFFPAHQLGLLSLTGVDDIITVFFTLLGYVAGLLTPIPFGNEEKEVSETKAPIESRIERAKNAVDALSYDEIKIIASEFLPDRGLSMPFMMIPIHTRIRIWVVLGLVIFLILSVFAIVLLAVVELKTADIFLKIFTTIVGYLAGLFTTNTAGKKG